MHQGDFGQLWTTDSAIHHVFGAQLIALNCCDIGLFDNYFLPYVETGSLRRGIFNVTIMHVKYAERVVPL